MRLLIGEGRLREDIPQKTSRKPKNAQKMILKYVVVVDIIFQILLTPCVLGLFGYVVYWGGGQNDPRREIAIAAKKKHTVGIFWF